MKKQRGSGLIFAVVLLFVILGMVVTLSSITVLETKMNQKTKSSVGAFYNSESGVEWALNQIATTTDPESKTINDRFSMSGGNKAPCPPGIGGPSICSIYLLGAEGKVLAPTATVDQVKAVRSVGSEEGDTQRAIEAAVAGTGDIPKGLIAIWSGKLVDIPTGWKLCDGTNGTPDYRSKFIEGAPAGQDPDAVTIRYVAGAGDGPEGENYTVAFIIKE